MIGRTDAVSAIEGLLGAAADSRAGALELVGEPGIGKTTLCRLAASMALAGGFQVITAIGIEWESSLELAALTQILLPLAAVLDQLTAAQAQLLRSVLDASPPPETDPFVLAAAVHSCLVHAADTQPVLVVLDDIQWLDATSAGVLAFALRRLEVDSVATVLARRPEVSSPFPVTWPRQELGGLSVEEVATLLGQLRPDLPRIDQGVAARIAQLLAGNPLAVEEFAAGLSPTQARGSAPLPDIPVLRGRGQLDFLAPISRLPEATRQALAVVAAAGLQDDLVPDALERLGLQRYHLDPALEAGLIDERPNPHFTHPLRRAAAYASAPIGLRRQVHATLAQLCRGRDPSRFAHHLDASGAPAHEVAAAMEQSAVSITLRAGAAASGPAWSRAAELSPIGRQRDLALVRAAEADFLAADRESAGRHLTALIGPEPHRPGRGSGGTGPAGHEVDDDILAEALQLHCRLGVWHETDGSQLDRLLGVLDRLAALDPGRAVVACTQLSATAQNFGELELSAALARRGVRLAADLDPDVQLEAACTEVHVGTLTEGAARVRAVRDLAPLEVLDNVLATSPTGLWGVAQVALWQEDLDYAQHVSRRAVAALRERNAMAWLPYALSVQAEQWWWRGDWDRAAAGLAEGLELIRQTGQDGLLGYALAVQARVLAGQGRHDECRRDVHAAVAMMDGQPEQPIVLYAWQALGLSDLSAGRPEAAVTHLGRAHAYAESVRLAQPTVVPYLGDYIEALAESDRRDQAATMTLHLERLATTSGSRWASAVLDRAHVLVHPNDPDGEARLRRSVATLAAAPQLPFERARSELVLGQHLRRSHRLSEARTTLTAAATGFEACGAPDWLARTNAERRAAGDRSTQPSTPSGLAQLTSQQLQVVMMVATGDTNKQVAASLFLSPKTVEYHLRRACTQLGVRNRVELTRYVARADLSTQPEGVARPGPTPDA